MDKMYHVWVDDEEQQYEAGTTYEEVAGLYQKNYDRTIALVRVGSKLKELNKRVREGDQITFVTTADADGYRAYRRTVCLLLQKAVWDVFDKKLDQVHILQSMSSGQYCELVDEPVTQELLDKIEARMWEIVREDMPLSKHSMTTDEAVKLFHDTGMEDKEGLFHYRRSSWVNVYNLGGYSDYFYGYMLPSTGYVTNFALELFGDGFVVIYPNRKTGKMEGFTPSPKLYAVQRDSHLWAEKMGAKNIGKLNDNIAAGRVQDIILMQEARMEAQIGELAQIIAEQPDKKFIMIAGPSSSGKTTFSHRLSMHLKSKGLHPHPIALDDYYVNRVDTPKDEKGEYDYECLEAVDIELFNKDMNALLAGEVVQLPTYNFVTGKREYNKKPMKLEKEDVLVIEGIHGLNDRLSYSLPKESKFRIYISALTQLAIDEHNALPTTDGRLIRRIVRDARTRGTSAQASIKRWESVRQGEEKNIFPFQEKADYIFNSALVYELAVLKVYAEPLLFAIPKDATEYVEAKRLLKFLDYFLAVPSEEIHRNSLIREFIGGSCFQV